MKMRSLCLRNPPPEMESAYVDALASHGLRVVEASSGDAIVLAVSFVDDAVVVASTRSGVPTRMSRSVSPRDLALFVLVSAELAELHERVGAMGDTETDGLVACLVAHDVNNLLVPMASAAEELVDLDASPVTELAGILADGCRRLATLVRRLLTLQRAPGAKQVCVNTLLGGLVPTLRTLAGTRSRLVTRFENPLSTILVDPLDLERAIVNLVVNARDAMPDGGDIVLATFDPRTVADTPGATGAGAWVVVEVADRGVGMDEETAARAFDPFFTTKPQGRGTGLGLASVRRIVRAASGEVQLHTQPGVGTRVSLLFPATHGACGER